MLSNLNPSTLLPTADILEAIVLPQRFEDSSNRLWLLKLADGQQRILRVRDGATGVASPFWPGLEALCGLSPELHLAGIAQLRERISALTTLDVPEIIASKAAAKEHPAWVLTSWLAGEASNAIDAKDVSRLAQHLARMHSDKRTRWGNPMADQYFPAVQWQKKIVHAIKVLIKAYWSNDPKVTSLWLSQGTEFTRPLNETAFTWVLADLRWDQFYWKNQDLYALIDFEAHLVAPKALDFITLEYLLDPAQARQFMSAYVSAGGEAPVLEPVRSGYRFFYFLLGILGNSDLDQWMAQPKLFE